MSAVEREPTRDELLAMAYADGELSPEARRDVERRLAHEPALAREVAAHERLHVLARRSAGPEPIDAEWERLARDPVHRAGLGLGWTLLAAAGLTGTGWLVLALARSSFSTSLKVLLVTAIVGTGVLLLTALRARLRTLPYDPYTDVRR